ncbi:MAG: hypothetical protein FWD65_08645 [Coriobacteriia bacterium]|nr:hypothetical protein [Coriobacteriia bacterium]
MADTQNTVPRAEAPTIPPAAEPATVQAGIPPVDSVAPQANAPAVMQAGASNIPSPQVMYLKTPFYKLVWFWIAVGLAAVCLCLMAGSIGVLVGRGGDNRMGRSNMMQMQNGCSRGMQDESGRGMQPYNYKGQDGQNSGSFGSLNSTGTPTPQQRLQKKGSGSGSSGPGGQTYVTPGPQGQMMVTPGY